MNDLDNKMCRDSFKAKTGGNGSEIGVSDGSPPGEGFAVADMTCSAIGSRQGAAGAAQPCENIVKSTVASQTESPVAAPARGGGSCPDDSVEAPSEYMHVNLLTFALFGIISGHPDPDLVVSASDGPVRALREGSDMRWPKKKEQ